MTTVEIAYHRDLLLLPTPDLRDWLLANGVDPPVISLNAKLGVRDGRLYLAEDGRPVCLGGDVPEWPVGPLPPALLADAELWLVADFEVGGERYGMTRQVQHEHGKVDPREELRFRNVVGVQVGRAVANHGRDEVRAMAADRATPDRIDREEIPVENDGY